MSATAAQRFLQDAATKSADLVHREIIRRGMDSYDAAHLKGRARIKDWEARGVNVRRSSAKLSSIWINICSSSKKK